MAKKRARVGQPARRNVTKKKATASRPDQISFDYIKSNNHRVIHVDGVTGSAGPGQDKITLSIFNERMPIARRETYRLTDEGRLGDIETRDQRDAIVRQVEVSLILNPAAAEAMKNWLETVLRQLESKAKSKRKVRTQKRSQK